jgi:cation:H+ antiporter
MLGTLAMFIGGVAVWYGYKKGRRPDHLILRKDHAQRDMKYFIAMYTVALVAGLLGIQTYFDKGPINYILAVILLAAYAVYMHRTLKDETEEKGNSCPALYACRICPVNPEKGRIGMAMIVLQVIAALLGIIIGAKFFVSEVEEVSTAIGISPIVLAFLIAPIATELPEKFNSVIWYLRSKDTLGFGNITGAMVFQSSFPVSIGLLFTDWHLEMINIASIIIALLASSWMLYCVRSRNGISYKTMLASGSMYLIYIVLLIFMAPTLET